MTNKIVYKTLLFIPVVLFGFMVFAHPAWAVVTLERLQNAASGPTDLGQYFAQWYRAIVGLATALAVVMLVIGGVQYTASGANPQALGEAKGRIWAAIGGLLLVLLSWIILNTINPALTRFEDPLSGAGGGGSQSGGQIGSSGSPTSGGGGSGGEDEIAGGGDEDNPSLTHEAAAAQLSSAGIEISSSGGCTNQNNSSCTSLTGIKKSTIDATKEIKTSCGQGCDVVVTGGTEIGHAEGTFSHGNGYKVDFRKGGSAQLDTFMQDTYGTNEPGYISGSTTNNNKYYEFKNDSNQIRVIDEGDHWDIQIIPLNELQGNTGFALTLAYNSN